MEIRIVGVIVLFYWILMILCLVEDVVDIDVLKDLLSLFLFCYVIFVLG